MSERNHVMMFSTPTPSLSAVNPVTVSGISDGPIYFLLVVDDIDVSGIRIFDIYEY